MTGSKIAHFGLARQYRNLKEELLDATDQVLSSGVLMNGEYTNRFESWLALRTKTNFAITVHSGTQALEIIAKFYVKEYQGVLEMVPTIKLPNLSYIATLNAFINNGWDVQLIDTDKNGLINVNPNELDDVVNSLCLVGLYGANPSGSSVFNTTIVDGAQHWLVADNIGDAMAISFDPTKNLPASGNGGAIVTNDRFLYDFAYSYRSNGKSEFDIAGTNSRMSEQECAQILVRSKYIDNWQWRRKEIRYYYLNEFKNLPFNCLSKDHMIHADQKFAIYTENRDDLMQYLIDKGIDVKIHYPKALSEYPVAKDLVKPDMLSTSVMLCRGLLSLPIYPELTDGEVEYIAKQVKSYFTC
jgi:dTDP-4-amino-4,6-dideoxygalactose transaminase